ncbi:hypothetical protein N7466_003217 [Penicillium verhagenii]|uniref:uncharacterized protein n=1 Tax=Penicillium verhagenii TaxID=1562060 RepID=UPI0025450370|nr:uncharacterized protein N7466_003217 [Penicillium verhagenii]KAJ5936767.1 hypothetical protein N7466_003217 [Penicillium verhagenii]
MAGPSGHPIPMPSLIDTDTPETPSRQAPAAHGSDSMPMHEEDSTGSMGTGEAGKKPKPRTRSRKRNRGYELSN